MFKQCLENIGEGSLRTCISSLDGHAKEEVRRILGWMETVYDLRSDHGSDGDGTVDIDGTDDIDGTGKMMAQLMIGVAV